MLKITPGAGPLWYDTPSSLPCQFVRPTVVELTPKPLSAFIIGKTSLSDIGKDGICGKTFFVSALGLSGFEGYPGVV